MTKLKPCPFCGGEAELTHTNDNNHYPFVRCKYGAYLKPKCMANMYPWLNYKTDEEAIEAWNRRSDENGTGDESGTTQGTAGDEKRQNTGKVAQLFLPVL